MSFDGAKVRLFLFPDKHLRRIVCEHSVFIDTNQLPYFRGAAGAPGKLNAGSFDFSGSPKNEASTSLSFSLNTMNFVLFSVQGVHAPPFGPLGSLYLAKLVQAVSIFSLRSQSPFVQGRQQCFRLLNTNHRSLEWKAPFRRCVTSGCEPSSGNGRANW